MTSGPLGWRTLASLLIWSFSITCHAADAPSLPTFDWEAQINLEELAKSPEWLALIHAPNGSARINNSTFLLSAGSFSAERELRTTLQLLFSDSNDTHARVAAICRFPARFEWLVSKLNGVDGFADPIELCPDLREFFTKAPAQRVALVYASENLVSPSSMMGHVLLKLSGTRSDGATVEHAISFFTSIEGLSLPHAIYRTLITGQQGYYTLAPYRLREQYYLEEEKRSILEFQLSLSEAERRHVQLPLHELRAVPMTYFFDSHNCATLTADLLAPVRPGMSSNSSPWMSPLDVIRNAHREHLVAGSSLLPTPGWKVRMYADQIGRSRANGLTNMVDRPAEFDASFADPIEPSALDLLFAESVAERRAQKEPHRHEEFDAAAAAARRRLQESHGNVYVDVSTYKRIEKSPPDSQWHLGYRRTTSGERVLAIRILPASRLIDDDQRNTFGRSELRLADTELSISAATGRPVLEAMSIYSVTSLMPRSAVGDGLTGRLNIGYEHQLDSDLHRHGVFEISGALGHTLQPFDRVISFALVGGGVALDGTSAFGYPEATLGLLIDNVVGTRVKLELGGQYNPAGRGDGVGVLQWTQLFPITANGALVFSTARHFGPERAATEFTASYRHYF